MAGVTVTLSVSASLRFVRRAFLAAALSLIENDAVPAPAVLVELPADTVPFPFLPSAVAFARTSTLTREPARATAIEPLTT